MSKVGASLNSRGKLEKKDNSEKLSTYFDKIFRGVECVYVTSSQLDFGCGPWIEFLTDFYCCRIGAIEGLREITEYVPQLWNWENHTRKASDVADLVVWFFHPRSSCRTHLMLFSERPPIDASCMTISGERTEQHCYNRFWRAGCSWLEYVDIRWVY